MLPCAALNGHTARVVRGERRHQRARARPPRRARLTPLHRERVHGSIIAERGRHDLSVLGLSVDTDPAEDVIAWLARECGSGEPGVELGVLRIEQPLQGAERGRVEVR